MSFTLFSYWSHLLERYFLTALWGTNYCYLMVVSTAVTVVLKQQEKLGFPLKKLLNVNVKQCSEMQSIPWRVHSESAVNHLFVWCDLITCCQQQSQCILNPVEAQLLLCSTGQRWMGFFFLQMLIGQTGWMRNIIEARLPLRVAVQCAVAEAEWCFWKRHQRFLCQHCAEFTGDVYRKTASCSAAFTQRYIDHLHLNKHCKQKMFQRSSFFFSFFFLLFV